MTRHLPALIGLLFLAACQSPSTRSAVEPPQLPHVPEVLKQPCAGVVDVPDRALSSAEAVRLWSRDRQSLGDCGRRHAGLVTAVKAIEGKAQ